MAVQNMTTAGAIKAVAEAAGLGMTFFRDRPDDATARALLDQGKAYGTIHEEIALTPVSNERDGTGRAALEVVQVDLWQRWKDRSNPAKTRLGEDVTLAPRLRRALDGSTLPTAPTTVYVLNYRNSVRNVDRDENVVHNALTFDVVRAL